MYTKLTLASLIVNEPRLADRSARAKLTEWVLGVEYELRDREVVWRRRQLFRGLEDCHCPLVVEVVTVSKGGMGG